MNIKQISRRLDIAIEMLRVNDFYLLKHDLNERSITHKLGVYLDQTFGKKYNVDCEYNRNIEHESNQKRICVLSEEIDKILRANNKQNEEILEKSVCPDIIVHKRGRNNSNLLIIEVKKSTSNVSEAYDIKKLECYTSHNLGNSLHYNYGVFIRFFTDQSKYRKPEIRYFSNGREIEL